jgi:hypothetical protein
MTEERADAGAMVVWKATMSTRVDTAQIRFTDLPVVEEPTGSQRSCSEEAIRGRVLGVSAHMRRWEVCGRRTEDEWYSTGFD